MKKKWYEGSKEPGVVQLCNMFRVEMAGFFHDQISLEIKRVGPQQKDMNML